MISLEVSAENAFVVFVGLLVGYVVFRRSATNHDGTATKADLGLAIFTAAATVGILGFLFGLGDGSGADSPSPASSSSPNPITAPVDSATTAPAAWPSPSSGTGLESD